MSTQATTTNVAASGSGWRRVRTGLSPDNVSAVYLGIALVAIFGLWIPETFLSSATFQLTLADQAVTGIVAVATVVPLACGVYDLSIGFALGLGATVASSLMANGTSPWLAVPIALACGLLIGIVNSALVVGARIDSFIATLATGSIIKAIISIVSDSRAIFGIDSGFAGLGHTKWFGVQLPVYLLLVIAIALWYVIEHTPTGRYLCATGANPDAARLAGVQVNRYKVLSLLIASVLGAFAGVVLAARIGGSSPDLPNSYLLPAFAAAFLGATQFRSRRPNVGGTILAVYVLAIGAKGFNLVGVEAWIQDLFYGVALVAAVLLSLRSGATQRPKRIALRRGDASPMNPATNNQRSPS